MFFSNLFNTKEAKCGAENPGVTLRRESYISFHAIICLDVCCFTGTLNVLLRVRSIASVDSMIWTKSGHQGPDWKKAFFDISPSGPFQVTAVLFNFISCVNSVISERLLCCTVLLLPKNKAPAAAEVETGHFIFLCGIMGKGIH